LNQFLNFSLEKIIFHIFGKVKLIFI